MIVAKLCDINEELGPQLCAQNDSEIDLVSFHTCLGRRVRSTLQDLLEYSVLCTS